MRTVIDIGTNSTLLLIGRLNVNNSVESIVQRFNVTRLGEGVHQTAMLNDNAIERTLNVLGKYRDEINNFGPMPVHLIGTQALRIAKNASKFVEIVKKNFNWDIRIISGDEEAQFSFIGAVDGFQAHLEQLIVMDLGGGSTEIILGEGNRITGHQSLPLGVVRAAEKLNMKENISGAESDEIIGWALDVFKKLSIPLRSSPSRIIGVGGTITTLAAIKEKMNEYDSEKINGCVLSQHDLWTLYNFLNTLSLAERRSIPGLVKGREDVILYGVLIFIAFLQYTTIDHVIASDRGLRFGVLKYEELQERI